MGTSRRELFGEVAVRKGFIRAEMVNQALKIQADRVRDGHKHKLIGIVLVELGMLGTTELIKVLQELTRAGHTPVAT